jgi:DNA helicase-2/ATP-dependent DNA helicase PcrA
MAGSLLSPSPEQQKVIAHRGGHLQVIACAGSGKTEAISQRIAALIVEGAAPSGIVAFTFTERAAASLKSRILQRVADRLSSDVLDSLSPMFVGTSAAHGADLRMADKQCLAVGTVR